ncbi:hypothetical protein CLU79DRAFT_831074 [Phycomyces nitens]|nr:hypothetical protein CLU79DRAFT_831074 [Phycomyces nitens]
MQLPSLGDIAVSNILVNYISTEGHSDQKSMNIILNHRVKLHEVTSSQSTDDLPWYGGHSGGGVVLPMNWLSEPAYLNGGAASKAVGVVPPLNWLLLIHWNRNDRKVDSKINMNLSEKWSILPNQWMRCTLFGNSSDSSVISHSGQFYGGVALPINRLFVSIPKA